MNEIKEELKKEFEEKFNKIITPQEAKILWHRLNIASLNFIEYCKTAKIDYPDDIISFGLWDRFNKLHKEPESK